MTKKANIVSLLEQAAAIAFLKALGADWHNEYLLLQVVAWLRVQEKMHPELAKTNNVFNLSTTTYYPYGGHKTTVFKFPSLIDEMKALAKMLLKSTDPSYQLIVTAAKNDKGNTDKNDYFLKAVVLSDWDAAHFGLHSDGTGDQITKEYLSFTGLANPKSKVKAVHHTSLPQVMAPGPPEAPHGFLSGFTAAHFYHARHPGSIEP